MQSPSWIKPGILGAIVGGIATMIVGFSYGGWYLGSSADSMAQKQSDAAVIAALVPVCVGKSQIDPQAATKLVALGAMKTSYEQRDYVMKAGWATMPAATAPDRNLATACAEMLTKTAGS
ncbi:MAG: hypothetical protein JNL25_07625 [Rhodospirillaceae bacterium]|nr:hypothetical protein [Rhodospirillaceae bacterium]